MRLSLEFDLRPARRKGLPLPVALYSVGDPIRRRLEPNRDVRLVVTPEKDQPVVACRTLGQVDRDGDEESLCRSPVLFEDSFGHGILRNLKHV